MHSSAAPHPAQIDVERLEKALGEAHEEGVKASKLQPLQERLDLARDRPRVGDSVRVDLAAAERAGLVEYDGHPIGGASGVAKPPPSAAAGKQPHASATPPPPPPPSIDEQHAFLDAAKEEDWDKVRSLAEGNRALVNVQPSGRWSALHQAAFADDERMVVWLLDKGANSACKGRDGWTPIDVAKPAAQRVLLNAMPSPPPSPPGQSLSASAEEVNVAMDGGSEQQAKEREREEMSQQVREAARVHLEAAAKSAVKRYVFGVVRMVLVDNDRPFVVHVEGRPKMLQLAEDHCTKVSTEERENGQALHQQLQTLHAAEQTRRAKLEAAKGAASKPPEDFSKADIETLKAAIEAAEEAGVRRSDLEPMREKLLAAKGRPRKGDPVRVKLGAGGGGFQFGDDVEGVYCRYGVVAEDRKGDRPYVVKYADGMTSPAEGLAADECIRVTPEEKEQGYALERVKELAAEHAGKVEIEKLEGALAAAVETKVPSHKLEPHKKKLDDAIKRPREGDSVEVTGGAHKSHQIDGERNPFGEVTQDRFSDPQSPTFIVRFNDGKLSDWIKEGDVTKVTDQRQVINANVAQRALQLDMDIV